MRNFRIILLLISVLTIYCVSYSQDHPQVKYGPEERQFMDIYIAPSDCPTPVYFDAHGNGQTIEMPDGIINALKEEGVSVVAWESLTRINDAATIQTGWDDAELMFQWVIDNAETYNFDTTKFIIGGSSRGSILSWIYGHRPNPNVRGLYMYNALPDGIWANPGLWYPPDEVTVESPPIFFVYRYEPGITTDIHDPDNGIIIMEKYDELGIGDRDTMIHSIQYTGNRNKYQFLVGFINSVIPPCGTVTSTYDEEEIQNYEVFPNPFQDKLEIKGVKGDEYFLVTDVLGQVLSEGRSLESLRLSELNKGKYFLEIRSGNDQKIISLMKN